MVKEETKKWIIKYAGWVLIVITAISIIGIRLAKPEISLKYPLIIGGIIVAISLMAMFGKNIKFNQEKENIKMSNEEIYEVILREADKRWNNIKKEKPFAWKKTRTINNDLIYTFLVNLNLDDEQFIIIINASDPKILPTVIDPIKFDKEIPDYLIEKEMNAKARKPEEKDSEQRIDRDLLTGKETIYTKTSTSHKEKPKEEAAL